MDQYLFLYPIKEYVHECIELFSSVKKHHTSELNKIIDSRYRKNGYEVNWLLFSQSKNLFKPDLKQASALINILACDRILVAGLSFKQFTKELLYPNSDIILSQLPEHSHLIIGGFHQWDCVDLIAKRAYERGIETFVDEDTTERFWLRPISDDIPLIRKEWSLEAIGIIDEIGVIVSKQERKNRPWLIQR